MNDLTVAMKLLLDSRGFSSGLSGSSRQIDNFTNRTRRRMDSINRAVSGVRGQLATLGVGIGAAATVMQSARLDKSLTQIGQTAGASRDQIRALRGEFFEMARETGQGLEILQSGFNNLVQSGLSWEQALATIKAINPASAVTGAEPGVLASGLTVASNIFDFDLTQPGLAVELLDQMTVAGRLGNAELEDLSGIFARVGPNARAANLQFAQTLGFIEQLSQVEKKPERLATLADSTLRLFTNNQYRQRAQQATGVPFFDGAGAARPAFDVLSDIATQFQKLNTDEDRAGFIGTAFKGVDLDTQKGLRLLLSGSNLQQIRQTTELIESAGSAIARDLPEALNNAVDQAGRLRTVMRQVADDFARPINKTFADAVNFSLKPVPEGGLGLSNTEAVVGGTGLLLGTAMLGGAIKGGLGRGLFGRAAGSAVDTGVGLVQGKALEQAAGVMPVFVVNMPGGGIGKGPSTAEIAAGVAAGGAAGKAAKGAKSLLGFSPTNPLPMLAVGAAGLAGVKTGEYIYDRFIAENRKLSDKIGGTIATVLAKFGSDEAQSALDAHFDGTLKIQIDSQGRARVQQARTSSPSFDIDVFSGPVLSLTP